MNGREKLKAALEHRNAPVPFDLGATSVTGIHCSVVAALRDYYGLEKRPVTIFEPYQMLGRIDEDLQQVMGIDTQPVWGEGNMLGFTCQGEKEWRTPWGQTVLVPDGFVTTRDDSGSVYIYAAGDPSYPPAAKMPAGSFFFDAIVRGHSFDENDPHVEDNLEEFGPISQHALDYLKANVTEAEATGRGIVAAPGGTAIGDIALVPGTMLRQPKGLRDIEEWYMATVLHQDYLHRIFSYQTDLALQNLEKVHAVLKDEPLVCVVCGTDFGTQRAPFCSRQTFNELYAPYYSRINAWIHTHTNWKTFKHSCGAIRPLIPDLLEAGFDILNPVQWTATDMEAASLKAEFGDRLVFWGGGIDTQHTLPFGTAAQVYEQATQCLRTFARDGGYVFSSIHNIQALTPVENVAALVRALHDFNRNER
ncbi:MAG: methyltransferase [Clostridia bacterium]|nr:methyltransferase [Clostridia bacterium]